MRLRRWGAALLAAAMLLLCACAAKKQPYPPETQTPATTDTQSKLLSEELLKNGRGYGVTFLAVWNRALYQQSFQKQAVQLFLLYQTGVHLGGKLDAQRAIETGLSITEQARVRPPETGFALEGTRLSEVYLPRAAAPAEEL